MIYYFHFLKLLFCLLNLFCTLVLLLLLGDIFGVFIIIIFFFFSGLLTIKEILSFDSIEYKLLSEFFDTFVFSFSDSCKLEKIKDKFLELLLSFLSVISYFLFFDFNNVPLITTLKFSSSS